MSRFNTRSTRPNVSSPVTTTGERTATYEGATGYLREPKSELYLLAVSNFVGQDSFYEKASDRDTRFEQLVRQLAVEDPAWTAGLLRWLRTDGNMRTASLVGAAEFVKARLDAEKRGDLVPDARTAEAEGGGWNRKVVDSVLQRPDEPGEMLGYWTSAYGRKIPKPVKRGIGDAVRRLYSERALLKYDTATKGYRFGDVLELVHAAPDDSKPWQGDLFKHAIDRRHGRDDDVPESLTIVGANRMFAETVREHPHALFNSFAIRDAGLTWEDVLSAYGGKVDKARLWEAIIPSMGTMALVRNLRNFDQAGVSDEVAAQVAAKISDPAEVKRSRQLPFRYYSAYNAAPSLRWGYALEKALTASLANIPSLPGRTLILVDTSGSMEKPFSKDGTLMRWDAAALFGIALGQRCASADVVSFSSARYYMSDRPGAKTKTFPMKGGESLLKAVERWKSGGWFLGGGTDTAAALRKEFAGHDRVVIVTDEQAGYDMDGVSGSVPATVPMYTWNISGDKVGHGPSGSRNRHVFAGLTDAAFATIPLLESGRDGVWPWEGAAA